MTEDAYARKEGFPTKVVMGVLAGIVVALWFIFGYGYQTSPPQVSDYQPPTIWLVYKGDTYTGLRGSYCWAQDCVDLPFREPSGEVDVARGSSISFMTNSLIEPSSMNVQAFLINDQGNTLEAGELARGEVKDSYTIDLTSDVYVVEVFAVWQDLGDVSYAFKIRVG